MANIAGDADDLFRFVAAPAKLEPFADGVFAFEIFAGESLVDDHHRRRLRSVAFGEIASIQVWNAERLKIIEADEAQLRAGLFALRRRAFDDVESSYYCQPKSAARTARSSRCGRPATVRRGPLIPPETH